MKEDDIFHPGVSEEQIRRAEELLGNLSLEMFVEKRSSSNNYRPGVLVLPGQNAKTIKVMVSAAIEERPGERALLASESIPESRHVQLLLEQDGRNTMLQGRVEPSHPGQRKDDQEQETALNVTLFHEQTE